MTFEALLRTYVHICYYVIALHTNMAVGEQTKAQLLKSILLIYLTRSIPKLLVDIVNSYQRYPVDTVSKKDGRPSSKRPHKEYH